MLLTDYESGLESRRRLIKAGVERGWCLVHANFDTLNDRCCGMEAAFLEESSDGGDGGDNVKQNAKFMGKIIGQNNGDGADDDWSGYGVLSTGR